MELKTVKSWKRTAVVLCGVGFFKEFFPSAPFFVDYALNHGNFTNEEISSEILPVTIYGHFVSLFIFLLITDLLRYRPIILLGGLSGIACWAMTIYSFHSKRDAFIRQILYSIEQSSEVAYITFMYEIVSRTYYKEVTSFIHASMHAGKFVAGALGQILLSYKILNLSEINLISFGGSLGVICFAIFLPGIKWTLYWHPPTVPPPVTSLDFEAQTDSKHPTKLANNGDSKRVNSLRARISNAVRELKQDIIVAYTNDHVARWSVWWAMSRAVYWQIELFTESLWKQIESETHQHPLNGAVDAGQAFISTLIAASIPFIKVPWELWAESYLAVIAVIQGLATLWMSRTKSLYIANVCYVLVQTTFEVVFILGASEIAGSLPDHRASFVFGINALIGILIQIIITNVVTTTYSFQLSIRDQFLVYGVYSIVLSLLFLSFAVQRRHKNWKVKGSRESKGLTKF